MHSTTIGVAATSEFLQQLVQELEDATAEYLVLGAQALDHEQEVELGSLITASSLVRLSQHLLVPTTFFSILIALSVAVNVLCYVHDDRAYAM